VTPDAQIEHIMHTLDAFLALGQLWLAFEVASWAIDTIRDTLTRRNIK